MDAIEVVEADSAGSGEELGAVASAPVVYVTELDVPDVEHLDQMQQLTLGGAPLWLGVLSDEGVRAITGARPLHGQLARILIAGHLRGVSQVLLVGPETDWRIPHPTIPVLDDRLRGHALPAPLTRLPTVRARLSSSSAAIRALPLSRPVARVSVA